LRICLVFCCNARRFTYVTNTRINIYEVDSIKNLSIIFELMQHLAPADKSNCPSTTFMSIYTFSLIERISIRSVWDSVRLYETLWDSLSFRAKRKPYWKLPTAQQLQVTALATFFSFPLVKYYIYYFFVFIYGLNTVFYSFFFFFFFWCFR
jgi:hypothetical protein